MHISCLLHACLLSSKSRLLIRCRQSRVVNGWIHMGCTRMGFGIPPCPPRMVTPNRPLRAWLQAYYKQAQLLKDQHALLTQRRLTLEDIPEELQVPVKKLRTLRPASALMEQLESIIPTVEGREERLQATFDLMFEWGRHNSFEMPAAVKAMYG